MSCHKSTIQGPFDLWAQSPVLLREIVLDASRSEPTRVTRAPASPPLALPRLAPRPRRPRGPRRILVVRLSAVGDVLHALPAVRALKAARPDVEIDWIVEDRAAPLLSGHPDLARVHVIPRAWLRRTTRRAMGWPAAAAFAVRLVARLLRRRYDATVDLQGNLKSGLFALLSGAPVRAGLPSSESREGNAFFLNRRVAAPRGVRHRVERSMRVLASVASRSLTYVDGGVASAQAGPAGRDAAARALSDLGLADVPFVVLHPGTSRFGAFKRWPAARFAALADLLHDQGERTLLTGAPGEESLLEEVRRHARHPCAALTTKDLPTLVAVLSKARALVAADTGPLHLAAALEVPVVGLFGPKDASVYGPYGRRANGTPGPLPVVVRDDVGCRPCAARWCPEPVCMSAIEPADVVAALRPLLGRLASRA